MRLTLFIDGQAPEQARLGETVQAWCDRRLGGGCRVEVLDVRGWPVGTENIPVLATPALSLDATGRLVVGDLSDVSAALAALGCVSPAA
ncbi:MAG: circadian clock protein KaiB [Solidesulfovibrio sp.]|uniref:circadian clock protein KaiB n=1 Tax=Solidesulfovibrio sp. TaxID=2910990 RepID=UPI002B200B0C|nr:circadian clock protein KaiB [Solidesulfovibrio sp.]MEA4858293.1 circadian clock protein KaiB [Solidesulfovibrio sp.]